MGIIIMDRIRTRTTDLPPRSRAGMLTVKPTVVKNRFWNTVCRVPSKVMLATPLTVRMQLMIENSRPPTRGAGIQ